MSDTEKDIETPTTEEPVTEEPVEEEVEGNDDAPGDKEEQPTEDNEGTKEEKEDGEKEEGEDGEEGEEGEEKPKKRRKKRDSPSPPPRRKAPTHAPPPPPPKAYDVPNDTWSSKPVSNRVWEVEEADEYNEMDQAEPEFDFSSTDLVKEFDVVNELGRGFFATTKLVKEKSSGEQFAVKVIDKSMAPQFGGDGLKSELDILSKFDHKNILKGKKLFDTETHLLVVIELAEGGELTQNLAKNSSGSYTEANVHAYAKQLVSALAHIHEKNVIHGDLAPENLLLSGNSEDSDLKLGGFSGAIVVSGDTENVQMIGNAEFQAPEIIMNQGFTKSADLWSLGCVLYFLVEGNSPFQDSNTMRMNMKIRQGKFEFGDNWSSVSESLKDLISKLIKVEPSERLSCADVLSHPWISGNPGNGNLPNTRANMAQMMN